MYRNMNHRLAAKDLQRAKRREHRRKHGATQTDGSAPSREMSQATGANVWRRILEEKEDPRTTHPLSFEEFDSIPDIGELIEKPIKQKGEYVLQNGEYILQKGETNNGTV